MSEHTTGPWKATESDPAEGAHVFWITAPQGCGPHNGEVDIATVPGNKPANAHLMAAAPELLEALKDCAADLEARIEHAFNEIGRHPAMRRDYEADISTVKAARAAIAKATSKRP